MKRYSFALDSNGHWQRRESPVGDYYRRDDLLSAGCLVPVPEGEECKYGDWLERQSSTAFIMDGSLNVHVIVNSYQSASGGKATHIHADTIVKPVRLVPLAELEADHG